MEQAVSSPVLEIKNNPIKTKSDLQALVKQLVKPLEDYFSEDHTHLFLGQTAAHYSKQVAGFEAFSRPLWGMAPLIAGGGSTSIWEKYIDGIKHGTNPEHQGFWGFPGDYDQRVVETAAFGLTLALCGPTLLHRFTAPEKDRLFNWLSVVSKRKTGDNNWNLFKVMVNTGLARSGMAYDQGANDEAFARIERYYLGNGWYSDGLTRQKDYYVSFAIHFYCLIYATLMEEQDPERARLFKDRAAKFANDFIYWFSADGSSFPFGRSMTYRFAQTAFWSALAFAKVESVSWGEVKGVVLRHLRWWMKQPIFTHDGVLTIGYGYPNLIMAENYNAPGSPYWAFKAFLVLTLSEDHPFWKEEEQDLPKLQEIKVQKHPQMIVCRDRINQHVFALTSGQYANFEPAHTAEKYAKFVYSNQFGFSVSKESHGLTHGAFDSMLALSEKDNHWRVRRTCEKVEINDDYIYSLWKPWGNVDIKTWLIPLNLWHIRIHHIKSERMLDTAEGGFAIPVDDPYKGRGEQQREFAKSSTGLSGIIDLFEEREFKIVRSAPNTNMLYPNVSDIPTLVSSLDTGSHWLAAAVLAHKNEPFFSEYWHNPPRLIKCDTGFRVISQEGERFIKTKVKADSCN
ncbi:hypothetical protein EV207_13043 [Scopulibacillus darangshiensis]|uniref:DUF2264 domain-containing protein n=1 Tax=Scopulibacillus darangshiensis TaxID=442528 RepID=A0A4R2NP12_9BACL|nr:DUF2264 domain-containing protein [Scopulibacillus darangshiensis]TCP23523.1 hypothetical protein EV207_13043 [Scopulibacillus darangshiensis]